MQEDIYGTGYTPSPLHHILSRALPGLDCGTTQLSFPAVFQVISVKQHASVTAADKKDPRQNDRWSISAQSFLFQLRI